MVNDGKVSVGSSVDIYVGAYLIVDELACLPKVVVDNTQACSVSVKDEVGNDVGGVLVSLYYNTDTDEEAGSCLTQNTGACTVYFTEDEVGTHIVSATAEKQDYTPDLSQVKTFQYDAYAYQYDLVGLEVFESYQDLLVQVKTLK